MVASSVQFFSYENVSINTGKEELDRSMGLVKADRALDDGNSLEGRYRRRDKSVP